MDNLLVNLTPEERIGALETENATLKTEIAVLKAELEQIGRAHV